MYLCLPYLAVEQIDLISINQNIDFHNICNSSVCVCVFLLPIVSIQICVAIHWHTACALRDSKVLVGCVEHRICQKVRGHLDTQGILTWFRHSFRAQRSCGTQLTVTMHGLHKLFDEGTQLSIGLLDLDYGQLVPKTIHT